MDKTNKILLGVIVVIVCIIFYMNTKTTKEGFEENTIEKPTIEKIYLKEDTPITWSGLKILAKKENENRLSRLPTQQEFEDAGINDGNRDMWMPASRTDGKLNEWIQTGINSNHWIYKSHINHYGPPDWGLNVLKWYFRPHYKNTINYIYVIYELSEAEAEARLKAAEEAAVEAEAAEAARLKAEADRIAKEAVEAARLKAAEAARLKAAEEAARLKAAEAARLKAAAVEAARLKAVEAARLKAAVEAARLKAAVEAEVEAEVAVEVEAEAEAENNNSTPNMNNNRNNYNNRNNALNNVNTRSDVVAANTNNSSNSSNFSRTNLKTTPSQNTKTMVDSVKPSAELTGGDVPREPSGIPTAGMYSIVNDGESGHRTSIIQKDVYRGSIYAPQINF